MTYVPSQPLPTNPATITFDSSLFTSKIFLTQLSMFAGTVFVNGGINLNIHDPATQLQLVQLFGGAVTILFRWLATTGPVSLGGPLRTQPNIPLNAGPAVIHIPGPGEWTPPVVQPLMPGTSSVTVGPSPQPTMPLSVQLPH